MQAGRAHRAAIDRVTAELDIHRSQHGMLMYLNEAKNKPSQKEICEHFDISAATVAVTLKKLEKNGFIERRRNGDDNRENRISITDKGREVLERTCEIFSRCDEKAFSSFTDEELEEFMLLLNKMKSNIEANERMNDSDEKMV